MSNRMNIDKVSDDDLQDMFTEVFENTVANLNNIGSGGFEAICKRGSSNPEINMEVTITGMAGSPTIDDFKNNKIKDANSITINREGKGSLSFKLIPNRTISLNTNDYLLVYKVV